ncbi:MAG TPA: magnesium transporter CorA family protein [Lachnospiraceae bacterium]|jgi:magnesium transporter|nr:magnesium transporter CorA family [Butyrivibrio sp. CAG:318]HJI31061.1 magnesium transporter CorA family protein [Lachnospiraceae bacterium]
MVKIFKTAESGVLQIENFEPGCWVAMTNPTAEELHEVATRYDIDATDMRAPLDEEERSRIDVEDNYTLILVDIPTIEERNEKDWYGTIPLSIVLCNDTIITVCLEDTPVLTAFMDGRVRNFYTHMKTRFIFQILYRNATLYLNYLRIIDRRSDSIEQKLHEATRNKELIELLELEKSLVFFTTSLKANEIVLEKLLKFSAIKKYPEDEDLIEDVIVENKQAIEMANIYSGILNGTMDTFASVISNNQNSVMKFLTTITIVLSIPTMIASFYGMNVKSFSMPFADSEWGFPIVIGISLIISLIIAFIFRKKDLF